MHKASFRDQIGRRRVNFTTGSVFSMSESVALPNSSRRPVWRKRLLFGAMSLVMALMTLEIGLRLAGLNFASPYVHDPQTGARLKSNHTFWHRSEGVARITTNCQGLRDRDHTFEKPSNVYRIAVLGDSFTEALQVEQPQTFWAILEDELNRQPPIPANVLKS